MLSFSFASAATAVLSAHAKDERKNACSVSGWPHEPLVGNCSFSSKIGFDSHSPMFVSVHCFSFSVPFPITASPGRLARHSTVCQLRAVDTRRHLGIGLEQVTDTRILSATSFVTHVKVGLRNAPVVMLFPRKYP